MNAINFFIFLLSPVLGSSSWYLTKLRSICGKCKKAERITWVVRRKQDL